MVNYEFCHYAFINYELRVSNYEWAYAINNYEL